MSEAETDATPGLLRAELPYAIMLAGAFVGVALNNFSGGPSLLYWQLLAPAYAMVCILSGWEQDGPSPNRMRLVRTQAIHWLACFIAMRLLFLPQIRGVLNDNATGLALLIVLALSTFLAGLHANAWRIAIVGVLLALAAPAAAWVEQSALLLSVEALLVLAIGALFFWIRAKMRA
jgi:hypothetical protein